MAITKAQQRAVAKYEQANYSKVLLRPRHEQKQCIQQAAEQAGQSLNAYILQAVEERMERDQSQQQGK